jgi:hypothetical protein
VAKHLDHGRPVGLVLDQLAKCAGPLSVS